ncbi:MAG: hypothetical protein JNL11_06835 [Bdellovibrionaceae bacterium]|nr:hypothetical protein [Pseudobdellovibrionaceae bacterium]
MILRCLILSIISVLFVFSVGCTYSVHQVPLSDFKPYVGEGVGTPIDAHAKQFVVMGFASETNYVDQAYKQLQGKCPHGVVTGIASKYYSEHGFFSWTNHMVMQGICVKK